MRRILLLLALVVVAAIGALAWTFTAATLPVPPPTALAMPPAMTTQGVEIKAIMAGKMLSRAGMAYRGGSLSRQ